MEPILTIDNLNSFGGNMLRQGDKSQLKYRLRDVGNKNLSISSKPCQVKMYGRNYTTVVYETSTTVSSENTVSFTIDKVLPKGTFYLEFTVGDYIFPTDHREFFEITPSGKGMESNIIEIVGVDVVVRKAVDLINADPNLIIDEDKLVTDIISNTGIGSIEEYYQQFNDVITELSEDKDFHSLPEIAGARRGYDTLAESLQNLSPSMLNPNLGKLTQNHMSDELLAQIAGNAAVNAIPADGSLTTSKYADASVSKEKTNFIKSSSNLLDVKQNTLNKIISAEGNIDDNLGYDISEFYEIKPGGTYTFFQVSHVLQYGENDNFINRTTVPIGESRTLTFPVNRKKIRLNILKSYDKPQFNEGPTLLPYEDYYVQLDEDISVSDNSIKNNSITNDKLTPKSVTIDKTTFLHPTQNLADLNKVRNDGYYAMQGVWVANDLFDSIVIDIPSGGDYITNIGDIGGRFLEVAYWDFDGRAVASNVGANGWSGSLTIPENIRKVAINYRQEADIQKMMFVQGNTLPVEYIPYGFTLDENILIGHEQSQKEPGVVTQGRRILIFGDSITETATMNEDGTNYKEMFTTWVTYAKDTLEPITIKNYARSGAAYRNRDYPGDRRKSLSQQVMMALDNNEGADIIVVSLGTNDGLTKVGDYDIAMSKSSKSELDLTNTAEAARWAYWTLRENYPEATIYCALPIQRADIEPPVELIETIEKVARRYNAIIINATDESGIVKDFEVWQGQGRYLADGLHPHEEGKKMMSKLYSRVILNTYTPNN